VAPTTELCVLNQEFRSAQIEFAITDILQILLREECNIHHAILGC
jgi:hypothetical protein